MTPLRGCIIRDASRISDDQPRCCGASQRQSGGDHHNQAKAGNEGFINRSSDRFSCRDIDVRRDFYCRQLHPLCLKLLSDLGADVDFRQIQGELPIERSEHHDAEDGYRQYARRTRDSIIDSRNDTGSPFSNRIHHCCRKRHDIPNPSMTTAGKNVVQ